MKSRVNPKQPTSLKATKGAQTAGRTLELLQLFVSSDKPMGLAELAKAARLNKSAAYRLLRELEAHAYLAREPDSRRYIVGSGLISLASVVLSKVDLRISARPLLERLWALTQETVILNIRHLSQRITIDGIESPHRLRRALPLGETLPLYDSTSGKVILAFLPESEIQAILKQAKQQGYNLRDLNEHLSTIRQKGFSITSGARTVGYSVLSVPVFSANGIIAAITISGPNQRFTSHAMQRCMPELLEATSIISLALGCTPPRPRPRPRQQSDILKTTPFVTFNGKSGGVV